MNGFVCLKSWLRAALTIFIMILVNSVAYAKEYELKIISYGQFVELAQANLPACARNNIKGLWEYKIDPVVIYDDKDYMDKYGKKIDFKSTDIPVQVSESFEIDLPFEMREHAIKGYYLDKDVTIDRNSPRPILQFKHNAKPNSSIFIFKVYIDTDVKKISSGNYPEVVAPEGKYYYEINGNRLPRSFKVIVSLGQQVLFESDLSDYHSFYADFKINKQKFFEALSKEKTLSVSTVDVKGIFRHPNKILFSQQYDAQGFKKALTEANGETENGLFLFRHMRCLPSWHIF